MPTHTSIVPYVFLTAIRERYPHAVEAVDGAEYEPRTPFRNERHINAEERAVDAEERHAALQGGRAGAEHRRVGVEPPEVVDRPAVPQPPPRREVLRVVAPRADLVQSTRRAPLEVRDDPAEVVGDHERARVAIEEPGEDEPAHGDARLVGPPEGPPQLVPRVRLARIVGDARRPDRMKPDRDVQLGGPLEHAQAPGLVQRAPVHVGEDQDAAGPQLPDGTLGR